MIETVAADGSPRLFAAYLRRARRSPELLGQLLEKYRPLLLLDAKRYINPSLARRVDPDDAVQLAMVGAVRRFDSFKGESESDLRAWLRVLNRNVIAESFRQHVGTGKRSVRREVPAPLDSSLPGYVELALATQSTPSQRTRFDERDARLMELVNDLPELQRRAILLRYLGGYEMRQLADELQRSVVAVTGLLKRGLAKLRQRMHEESWLA